GPHEYYSRYRGVIPIFVYHCLTGQTFPVYGGHRRIFDYVDDTCRTFANVADNFIPGEVYNVGSDEAWVVTIEELARLVATPPLKRPRQTMTAARSMACSNACSHWTSTSGQS
ncbi:MAG: hypothetical protein ACE5E8_07635, partial [Acidimicrobiia bacterium]